MESPSDVLDVGVSGGTPWPPLPKVVDAHFAPDTVMINAYLEWQKNEVDIAAAMVKFNFQSFRQHRDGFVRALEALGVQSAPPPTSADVKEEGEEDHDEGEKDDEEDEEPCRLAKKRKTSPNGIIKMHFVEQTLALDAAQQFGALVIEAVKARIYESASEAEDSQQLELLISALQVVCAQWRASLADYHDSFDIGSALSSACACFMCMRSLEAGRPGVAEARSARRSLVGYAKERGPAADLAKGMATFPLGQLALEAALSHSKAGIADELATRALEEAANRLEDLIEPHAEALAHWALFSNAGGPQTFESFGASLACVKGVALSSMSALMRLSASGLDAMKDLMGASLSNCLLVLQVGVFVGALHIKSCMGGFLKKLVDIITEGGGAEELSQGQLELGSPAKSPQERVAANKEEKAPPLVQLVRTLCSCACNLQPAADQYMKSLAAHLQQLQKVFDGLVKRLGDASFAPDLAQHLANMKDQIATNIQAIVDIHV